MPDLSDIFNVLGWVPLLCILGAALVCFTHLQISRRMVLLLVGFLGLGVADIGSRVLQELQRQPNKPADADFGTYYSIVFVVRVACWIVVVTGLALVFADLRDRVEPASHSQREDGGEKKAPWIK
jgi:hypothetical protein